MLEREKINALLNRLKQYSPEEIYIKDKQTISNPDVQVMFKKDGKEFLVKEDLDSMDTSESVSIVDIDSYIHNAKDRSTALLDFYTKGTAIYPGN